MSEMCFDVSVSVDQTTGRLLATYLRVRSGKVAETREIDEGRAFADYDEEGHLLGVELIATCPIDVLEGVATGEPENVRLFLLNAIPRQLISSAKPLEYHGNAVGSKAVN